MTASIKTKLNYLFAIFFFAVFGLLFSASSASATTYTSTFTSQIIDTGQKNTLWGNATWTADNDVPANTTMTVKARSCDDARLVPAKQLSAVLLIISV